MHYHTNSCQLIVSGQMHRNILDNFLLRPRSSRSRSRGRRRSRSRPSPTVSGEFSREPPHNARNHFSGSHRPSALQTKTHNFKWNTTRQRFMQTPSQTLPLRWLLFQLWAHSSVLFVQKKKKKQQKIQHWSLKTLTHLASFRPNHLCVRPTRVTGGRHNHSSWVPALRGTSFAPFECSQHLPSSINTLHSSFRKLCLESTSHLPICYPKACEAKWLPLFGSFAQCYCDVLTGWSCLGNWQLGMLYTSQANDLKKIWLSICSLHTFKQGSQKLFNLNSQTFYKLSRPCFQNSTTKFIRLLTY